MIIKIIKCKIYSLFLKISRILRNYFSCQVRKQYILFSVFDLSGLLQNILSAKVGGVGNNVFYLTKNFLYQSSKIIRAHKV